METSKTTPARPAKTAVSALTLGNADDALTLAKELQKFVKDNKLTSTIQGKEFPNIEAWQFAGSLLGLTSILESIEDKSTDTEIKWQAMITLHQVKTGEIVGRGFATCSNKEHTKRGFADYAICSMAQTRAVGKAYRLTLGWLMKAAGYEATPAEELSETGTSAEVVAEAPRPSRPAAPEASAPASLLPAPSATAAPATSEADEWLAKATVLSLLNEAETLEELQGLWLGEAKPFRIDVDVYAAKEARKQHLQANQTLSQRG